MVLGSDGTGAGCHGDGIVPGPGIRLRGVLWVLGAYQHLALWLKTIYYIILYIYISIIRRPRLQQGERVRGGITSSKGQEVITSSKGKKQENKKEEARSKKHLQATSGKKQERTSQEATSGWKTCQRASFLVDSESNVRQAAGRQLRELAFL